MKERAAASDIRVLILAGGMSYEHEISLKSGRRAADALQRQGMACDVRDLDGELLPALQEFPPDVVLPLVHGQPGEDGSLQAVLELIGLPIVGTGSTGARRAWNKITAKDLLRTAGIPTPDWTSMPRQAFSDFGARKLLDRIAAKMGLPLIVKPNSGGSGLGVHAVRKEDDFPSAMMGCFSYSDTALIETFVEGRDIAVGVVDIGEGPTALPPVEIAPLHGDYDYAARYNPGATRWTVPAALSEPVAARVAELALKTHRTLGLGDMSRVDLMVDDAGGIQVLEANVAPGTTETSLLPMAIDAAGLDFGEVLATMVRRAIARS
ncbi:D-alanine--D-alanine ligase family protein [Glycomyces albidus]|jgi:D-alanine-D-alanine ligase|uniref:D-alanine--D-alanine ligase n=1 Tax=Glycomyces albidus TaxID=2656774 RepID=A0A6L5GBT1_9ACTN|nr:D-alanine--D-alanine ligase [Glycomyces albidus]MQM27149.1 D-alanine--D-alanine ligase [Glycomyces albidus]